MNKKARSLLFVGFAIILSFVILFIIHSIFVLASHTTSPELIIVNQSVVYVFNITVNNTNDASELGNITEVNITLPAGFSFVADSNLSSVSNRGNFTNTTNVLTWRNTSGYIINGSVNNSFFRFNASSNLTALGYYNITVVSFNATAAYQTNVSVLVKDITSPYNLTFMGQTPASHANLSQTNIPINITSTDNVGISAFQVYLFNATALVNNTNISSLATGGGTSFGFVNFTSLADSASPLNDGVYYVNVTSNDTSGNFNSTSGTLKITLDTTVPGIAIALPINNTNSSNVNLNVNYTVSDVTTSFNCWYSNDSYSTNVSLANCGNITTVTWTEGQHNVTVYANDSAGNLNKSTIRFTIDNQLPSIYLSKISSTTTSLLISILAIDSGTGLNGTCNSSRGTVTGTSNITESSLSCGTSYSYNVTCYDNSGNSNSNLSSFSTSDCAAAVAAAAPSGGGGGSTSVPAAINLAVSDGYTKQMYVGETLSFKVDNQPHSVYIQGIIADSVVIKLSSEPQIVILKAGEEKKIDLTNDSYYDLFVRLNAVKNGVINLTIKDIHESKTTSPVPSTSADVSPTEEAPSTLEEELVTEPLIISLKAIILIIVAVIIVAAIAFFIISRKRHSY